MEFFRRAVPVIFAALVAVSCTKSSEEPYSDKELRSFEKWMELNINTGGSTVAEKLSDGLYIQWLKPPVNAQAPKWGDYVEIEYRGLLIGDYEPDTGNATMFMTRLEEDAKKLGTFTHYTRYVPQMVIYNKSNNLMPGMQAALEKMNVGDSIRIFMTSPYASSYSALTTSYGYEGNTSVPSGLPAIVEMKLTGIVEQPQTKEENYVNDFAKRQWGQSLRDTVREYVYMKIHNGSDLIDADTVKTDSTARIYYAAFIANEKEMPVDPGYVYVEDPDERLFLIETNIDEIAERHNRTVSTSTYVSYKPSSAPESPKAMAIKALNEIFLSQDIRYGSKFEFITTSSYAYGSSGQSPASETTEVLPYQPIFFYVLVEKYDYGDDE